MNKLIGKGRLTGEPEIRYTTDGKAVTRMSIALPRRFKKDGEPDADFFNCVAFGKTAETMGNYLHKGSEVLIDGELRNSNYEKDGVKHYSTQIIVNSFEFCGSKSEQAKTEPTKNPSFDDFMSVDGFEEELPFN